MAANSVNEDAALIARKVLLGLIIMVVPLIIIAAGLWLVQTLL